MTFHRALLLAAIATPLAPALADVPKPAAIVADGVPAIPDALAAATQPYLQTRKAAFLGWNEATRGMLIKTRFGNTDQLHTVAVPDAARQQVSFEGEPILTGSVSPGKGDVTLVQKDVGGGEFYQLYRLSAGRLQLLTDGKSRNWFGAWSRDGRHVGYSSTRRNGADADLYVIDPRDPGSERKVAEVRGGGWNIADFSPDGTKALVLDRQSINKADLYEMDLASGRMTPLTDPKAQVSYEAPHYAPDGRLWVISDAGSDFLRLGTLDRASGAFRPVSREAKWDVGDYALSPDGATIAYATNEAGVSRLHVLDTATGAVRAVSGLPAGVIPWSIGPAIQISPWGQIGFSMSSARVAGDVFSVDAKTLAVTRWTHSETGGLDPNVNAEPTLVEVKSFDGQPVSGFLYRPDPAKFPGKRPVIVDIHGGPEGQTRPDYLGATNYLINELGIAVFFPNVRGSSGFGKRFVNLDNGPFKREDSVRDIGAFLDALQKDPMLDAARFAVNGVSYGGYMCYATATHYSARLKGANCYVAISNFVTFLQNTQSYRRDLRRVEYGDERDPVQRAQLLKISPLTSVDKIRLPLLIATGGNDPRVPASEAEQIIAAVRGNGGTAWHLLAKNEGHVFHKKENEDYYFYTSILFSKTTLLRGGAR
ncbi:dipeptidyl aminopeptidase/acylaminoacyl peptidase [Sphingomonas insulae]|uniref:S9 family peptidase n=1 Tax=Sphingomonas insulae TaxID=424800 RepID=A0ABN1HQ81_9SPHN|nr:prolyl oligopeptidase family serine peptidase [Sphingomonas insulae]NIJ31367.1 dipeptidyl aminopeptidase/acylaminoacyl peptidase [Sphingomonas insulae]